MKEEEEEEIEEVKGWHITHIEISMFSRTENKDCTVFHVKIILGCLRAFPCLSKVKKRHNSTEYVILFVRQKEIQHFKQIGPSTDRASKGELVLVGYCGRRNEEPP